MSQTFHWSKIVSYIAIYKAAQSLYIHEVRAILRTSFCKLSLPSCCTSLPEVWLPLERITRFGDTTVALVVNQYPCTKSVICTTC